MKSIAQAGSSVPPTIRMESNVNEIAYQDLFALRQHREIEDLELRRNVITALVILVLLIFAASAYTAYYLSQQQASIELRVFAAASLTHVIEDNSTLQAFEQQNNVKILFNVGGSDTLYQQIYSGSPADVFMAADSSWLQKLNRNGLLHNDQYWNFTSNILVVIIPPDNPAKITSLLDLTKPGVKIAVTAWTVPAGKYTNMTLTKIDATWGSPASSKYKGPEWEKYRERFIANVITYETNVEQVVGKVLTDTVDVGVAYASDATFLGQSKLKYLPIPPDVNVQAKYGIGVLSNSTQYDLAMKYVNFWLSQEGQTLLAKYGFGSNLTITAALIGYTILQLQIVGENKCQTRP
jgi:molybdate transport system substrate-binding protein